MHPLYDKYQRQWEILFWLTLALFNTVTNSLSAVADHQRQNLDITQWEPWLWHASSQIGLIALVPLVVLLIDKWSLSQGNIKRNFLFHVGFSVVFSLFHVFIMVFIRTIGYWLAGSSYDFGDWAAELLYEYRKDLRDYISIVTTLYIYRFVISRLRAEAKPIARGEESEQTGRPQYVERFIVKKFGKEFIVEANDIQWIEASGNYMNLHIGQHTYPIRETMTGLVKQLDPNKFARIHRSYMVHLEQIAHIEPKSTGDFAINLKNGEVLNLSRRYRENLKAAFQ